MFIYYFIFNKVRGNTSCAVIATPTLGVSTMKMHDFHFCHYNSIIDIVM